MKKVFRHIKTKIFYLYHFLLLKFFNVHIKKMPVISGLLYIRGRGVISIGNNVKITSSIYTNPVGLSHKTLFFVSKNAYLRIGNEVGISNSLLFAKIGIEIEDKVMIGGGCQILDSDFHPLDPVDRNDLKSLEKINSKPILVKRGAFIGANSIILKGVTIGENSIIGAGSVLRVNVPDNEIWAGNPAVYVGSIENTKH